jgi:hypothetical protein
MIHEEQTETSMLTNQDEHGFALQAAKEKWASLGPLKLADIVANSQIPIDQHLQFGISKYNKYIRG